MVHDHALDGQAVPIWIPAMVGGENSTEIPPVVDERALECARS